MTENGRTSGDRKDYSVTQIRGPFLELPPHEDHTQTEAEFREYCARLRSQGKILAADLFAGAGGLSLGLEDAGFKVVLGVDHYLDAVKTHRHHFGGLSTDWDLSTPESIERVAVLMKECEIDLLAGGPPCQPFSKAGRNGIRRLVEEGKREAHDQRRDLWRSYLEIVSLARPRAIIMENVPDMALDEEMFILRSMIEELEQLGYSVFEKVVEMWRYGVPQTRQRLILVALRDGKDFQWPKDYPQKVTLGNAIGEMPEIEGGWRPEGGAQGWVHYDAPQTEFQAYIRRRVSEEDRHKLFDHITRPVREDDREAFELMDATTKYSDLPERLRRYRDDIYDDKYKRLDENDLSRTITAHIAKDGYGYIHPRQPRTLTVREAARVQTFPDDFRFNGPPSSAFKQIGNAVPPRAAAAIAIAVKSAMETPELKSQPARQTSQELARWFGQRDPRVSAQPWLWTDSRWKALLGEVLLSRQRQVMVKQIWPVIDMLPGPSPENPKIPQETVEVIRDMLRGIGGTAKLERFERLVEQVSADPGSLWQAKIDRLLLPELRSSEARILELIVPMPDELGEQPGEPVLNIRGVNRVTSRFQGIATDRKNQQTEGRIAIARMLALNEGSRAAHLAIIELAQTHCRVKNPLCSVCPLEKLCTKFGVDEASEPALFDVEG